MFVCRWAACSVAHWRLRYCQHSDGVGYTRLAASLPLLCAVLLWMTLPESPRFLARRSEHWLRLARLLTRIGNVIPAGGVFEDRPERGIANRASLCNLFRAGLARETAGLWIQFFFCLGSIYLMFGWLPAMLTARGLNLAAASSALAIYNLGGVLGILAWAMIAPVLGSRGPVLFGALAPCNERVGVSRYPGAWS